MAKAKGETSQGLVVALVFFILSTITLGVTTYLGYSQQEDVEKKIADADAKATAMKASRDWFKWQAMAYRAAMGHLTLKDPQEFGTIRKEFIEGQLGKNAEDREDVTKLIRDVLEGQKGFAFDTTTNRYKSTYENLVAQANADAQKVVAENATLQKQKTDLETTLVAKDKQIDEMKKGFDASLKKLSEENLTVKDKQDVDKVALAQEVKRLGEVQAALLNAAADEKKKLTAELKKALDLVNAQKQQLQKVEGELLTLKSKGRDIAERGLKTDWKIVTIQGGQPYINLGSADNVKTQLTFNIHGLEPNGQPKKDPKGSLEVINIIGPHLSQARYIARKDEVRDPVLTGDVLNNASWDPFVKRHVAIAGYIDLHGDGRDSLPELLRILERQNVIVDAYFDMKELTIKGAMTLQTEKLILGHGSETLPPALRQKEELVKKLSKGIEEMKSEAAKNGVPSEAWNLFLEKVGYKVQSSQTSGY